VKTPGSDSMVLHESDVAMTLCTRQQAGQYKAAAPGHGTGKVSPRTQGQQGILCSYMVLPDLATALTKQLVAVRSR
jgi:hypothetical protein